MKRVPVGFWNVDAVLDFLKITAPFDYDMDLVSGNSTVNAKSLFSVFSIKYADGIELLIHHDECDDLLKKIDSYVEFAEICGQRKSIV